MPLGLNPNAQALLREAADLIARALAQLDTREETCGECHGPHFVNFAHAKVHRQFVEQPRKLREAAAHLDTKDLHTTRATGAQDQE